MISDIKTDALQGLTCGRQLHLYSVPLLVFFHTPNLRPRLRSTRMSVDLRKRYYYQKNSIKIESYRLTSFRLFRLSTMIGGSPTLSNTSIRGGYKNRATPVPSGAPPIKPPHHPQNPYIDMSSPVTTSSCASAPAIAHDSLIPM